MCQQGVFQGLSAAVASVAETVADSANNLRGEVPPHLLAQEAQLFCLTHDIAGVIKHLPVNCGARNNGILVCLSQDEIAG